jgi:hypothetical protein
MQKIKDSTWAVVSFSMQQLWPIDFLVASNAGRKCARWRAIGLFTKKQVLMSCDERHVAKTQQKKNKKQITL